MYNRNKTIDSLTLIGFVAVIISTSIIFWPNVLNNFGLLTNAQGNNPEITPSFVAEIPANGQACLDGETVPDKGETWTDSNGLLDVLAKAGYYSHVKVGGQLQRVYTPATVIAGLLTWENPYLISVSKEQIDAVIQPGARWEKDCGGNEFSAGGPFQFTNTAWTNYGNAIVWATEAGMPTGRTAGYKPERCNLLDSAYAAAAMLKDNLRVFRNAGTPCERFQDEDIPTDYNWSNNDVIMATCHFYGATGDGVCSSVDANKDGTPDRNMCYSSRAVYYKENFTCDGNNNPPPVTPTVCITAAPTPVDPENPTPPDDEPTICNPVKITSPISGTVLTGPTKFMWCEEKSDCEGVKSFISEWKNFSEKEDGDYVKYEFDYTGEPVVTSFEFTDEDFNGEMMTNNLTTIYEDGQECSNLSIYARGMQSNAP